MFSNYEHPQENEVNVTFKEPGSSNGTGQKNTNENQTGTQNQTTPNTNKPATEKEPPKGVQPAL